MSEALEISLVGIAIVFVVLAMTAGVVALMGRLDRRWQQREAEEAEAALVSEPTIDATTLVLISAAVATYLQGRYRIRSVRRVAVPQRSHGWSAQGRAVLMGSHVVPRK